MLSLILATAVFAPQGPGTSTAPVVINEFVCDDSGVDEYEFVELYNRSNAPVDISLWLIRSNDPGSPPLGAGSVPTHMIAAGTVLQPGAFYLIGSNFVVPTPIPGISQQWANNALENGDSDTVELTDLAGNMLDEITYELDGAVGVPFTLPLPAPNTNSYTYPGEHGISAEISVGNGPTSSAARLLDGWDNNHNSLDFGFVCPATPGATNVPASQIPYFEIFDLGAANTLVPGWTGGFVPPMYDDPTSPASTNNLQARVASPVGGLAMTTWDASGGGNTVTLNGPPISDVVVDTYVYIEPLMSPASAPVTPYNLTNNPMVANEYNGADGEYWALGVRGTTTPNGNAPDLGTYWADVALGVGTRYHSITGICWAHVRTPGYSTLYLLDCKDGPTVGALQNHDVIATIPIIAGINDGWQRIRIHAQGNNVIANFGGNPGFDDGQRFAFSTTTTQVGQVYIAYREYILYNSNGTAGAKPPAFDLLDIHVPTTTKTFLGVGSPTNANTPTIDTDGLAIPGSTGFAVLGSNLVPQGGPGYAFCGLQTGFTAFPAGFAITGAPATALSYVLPALVSQIGFADVNGDVAWAFPLPPNNSFLGIPLVNQIADFDLSLTAAVPIGVSPGMETIIGN